MKKHVLALSLRQKSICVVDPFSYTYECRKEACRDVKIDSMQIWSVLQKMQRIK